MLHPYLLSVYLASLYYLLSNASPFNLVFSTHVRFAAVLINKLKDN